MADTLTFTVAVVALDESASRLVMNVTPSSSLAVAASVAAGLALHVGIDRCAES